MAIEYHRCIFEILGKLTSLQLNALCNFIAGKVALLENDIRKALSVTDQGSNQVVSLLENLNSGINAFNSKIGESALFGIAKSLGPNCGPVADVFGGAFHISELTGQAVADTTFIIKQMTSASAKANTALNYILDETAALKDICTIARMLIEEKTKNPDEIKETFKRLVGTSKTTL